MIVGGASRHAKEILQILRQSTDKIILFDDVSEKIDDYFKEYIRLKDLDEIQKTKETEFVLATGGTKVRNIIAEKLEGVGLKMISVISNTSVIGIKEVKIGAGVNLMNFVFVSDAVEIGKGSLINAYSSIHHDVKVGEFCDISPRVTLLGGAEIGDFTWVGAGAIVLPNIKVGNNCIIGAGSVVNRNIPDHTKSWGVPAKIQYDRT